MSAFCFLIVGTFNIVSTKRSTTFWYQLRSTLFFGGSFIYFIVHGGKTITAKVGDKTTSIRVIKKGSQYAASKCIYLLSCLVDQPKLGFSEQRG